MVLPLLITPIRQRFITLPLLGFYSKILPPLSDTEKVALEAGTVGFEGELFSGNPDWQMLLSQPKPSLTAEEQAFIDGPVETRLRHGQRLGNHPCARRSVAGSLGVPEESINSSA